LVTEPPDRALILHEDEALIVANKPAGMLGVPVPNSEEDSLLARLDGLGLNPLPAHSLDRDISGVMLFARDQQTAAALADLFRERKVEEFFWALVQGDLHARSGRYAFPIVEKRGVARVVGRGDPAETRWRVIASHPGATEVEADLRTGRPDQVRLHFRHAGHPVQGDGYPRHRLALHAWRIVLPHPLTGKRLQVEAPLPDDLVGLRARGGAEA